MMTASEGYSRARMRERNPLPQHKSTTANDGWSPEEGEARCEPSASFDSSASTITYASMSSLRSWREVRLSIVLKAGSLSSRGRYGAAAKRASKRLLFTLRPSSRKSTERFFLCSPTEGRSQGMQEIGLARSSCATGTASCRSAERASPNRSATATAGAAAVRSGSGIWPSTAQRTPKRQRLSDAGCNLSASMPRASSLRHRPLSVFNVCTKVMPSGLQ